MSVSSLAWGNLSEIQGFANFKADSHGKFWKINNGFADFEADWDKSR